jgi:hypothetical protein
VEVLEEDRTILADPLGCCCVCDWPAVRGCVDPASSRGGDFCSHNGEGGIEMSIGKLKLNLNVKRMISKPDALVVLCSP